MAIAYQLRGGRFATSGAWGASYWGTAPWGGQQFPIVPIPAVGLGSDDLTRTNAYGIADIVLTRNGQTIAVRPYSSWPVWRVVHPKVSAAELAVLWQFCEARVFNLLPQGTADLVHVVYWVGAQFRPVPIGPDSFSLEYTLEKVTV